MVDSIQVTWIGHATVLVQMEGLNILTDPVFSEYCGNIQRFGVKRYRPVPCTVDELPDIDAVCISHNHYDHLDHDTVCDLNKRFRDKVHWYVPLGLLKWMKNCGCKNVVELEWWDEHSHPKFTENSKATPVKFAFTPAQHWCRRGLNDVNEVLWGSWSIIGPRHRFFFAADSGYCHIFKQIGKRYGPFDLAAIPIGAYEPRYISLRGTNILSLCKPVTTTYGLNSFRYFASKTWNSLSNNVSSEHKTGFRRLLEAISF